MRLTRVRGVPQCDGEELKRYSGSSPRELPEVLPSGANGHIERVPRLPERVVPQHRLDRRRERARPGLQYI